MPDPQQITATWQHRGMVFSGAKPGKPPVTIDGKATEGPSPMDALLIAVAGCTGADVVLVLEKKRIDLRELRIAVTGTRREELPQRYTAIRIVYTVTAPGATEQAVRHAIDLSLATYCSVTHSLNPDIPITYELVLQA
jgi:putative redox protein